MFKPEKARQMTTPVLIQSVDYEFVKGVNVKNYRNAANVFVNWASYGGTEVQRDGVLAVEDTAQLTTWFNPNITSGCRVIRRGDGAIYEIIGEPENIEMRNILMSFKVRRVKGGA